MKFFFFAFLILSCVTPSSMCSEGDCDTQSAETSHKSSDSEIDKDKFSNSGETSEPSSESSESSSQDDPGKSPSERDSQDQIDFKLIPSQLSEGMTYLILSLSKNIKDSELNVWRENAECEGCSNRVRLDFLTINQESNSEDIDWEKIIAGISDRYEHQLNLKLLIYPDIQESFLSSFLKIYGKIPSIDRVILLDPGAIEGLNGVIEIASAGSKISKSFKKMKSPPSLEVLALFTGRGFEKDRRRIMAGNSVFFYTELGMSDRIGPAYLVDWFIKSRNGIKSPFSYGGVSNKEITEIRGISPAAWFQRASGSLTEDQSDDVLKLMLP
jgi:hypothetical protein